MQNMGAWRNVTYMLGNNPLLWCCPATPPGTGLNYPVVVGDGEWVVFSSHTPEGVVEEVDFGYLARPSSVMSPSE